ncbi:hypothetical protein C2857_000879 [Epichloe festucae Fl1]|uniref:DnaJ homologue subfamily C member 28 conserved domain-containing protein n=1 Tax=Epichloe festucae (strain Fl1) TaxID=877507 RepID=A0A7S9PX75_EPIFF|nr:hypothetical protein C2857_000879 [Epichloe festucae Fl1]
MQSPHLARFKFCRRCVPQGLPQALHKTWLHRSAALRGPKDGTRNDNLHDAKGEGHGNPKKDEPGPMSRRLEEATEEALLSGGASGRRAIEDAGFSEELKEKLLDKVAGARFQQQYKGAFAQAGISPSTSSPPAVQAHASHISSGNPWTGTEDAADAVLRMLHDAKKPLRPGDRGKFQPPVVDTRIRRRVPQSPGQRVVSARDKANMYVGGMDTKTIKGLSDEEREEIKAERRERFQPAARAVPSTLSGIAALANQRIEDAIARGQFKDLPRGKEMERDPRANSPFIDTTEYLMNRMIQRQELVPPWIEKQQELTKAARVFRERLRNDWKRHASRMIASRGGSLEEQMRRAEVFAAAELAHNPRRSSDGENSPSILGLHGTSPSLGAAECTSDSTSPDPAGSMTDGPVVQRPFRDPDWEIAETAYVDLSIENLNSITRSYNLMAPELARKPYFSIDRELKSCFADMAPLIANEIKVRAVGRSTAGTVRPGKTEGSTLAERIFGKDDVKIHLEANEKVYGLREWWRDFWKSG